MKRAVYVLLVLTLFAVVGALPGRIAADATDSNWLQSKEQNLTKVADLPDNTEPFSYGVDCTPISFKTGLTNSGQEMQGCAIETIFGTIANDYVVNGSNGTLRLNQLNHVGFVMTSPSSSLDTIITSTSPSNWGIGDMLQVSTYSPGAFTFISRWGVPMIYGYEYSPTSQSPLKDAKGTIMRLFSQSMAYSSNGKWLAVVRTDGGIMRYDTANWSGKLIGWDKNYALAIAKGNNLAVSDSGKYIALNANTGTISSPTPSLKVFDVDSCQDLAGYAPEDTGINRCEYNDVWNGTFRGKSYGPGLKAQLPTAEYPRHIRFAGNNAITFDAVYDRTSPTTFKVAAYSVTNEAYAPEPIELLGMGDSYISGEGAFGYRADTDTANNACHNSIFSYPYLVGTKLYNSFESVACSGAKMNDITTEVHYQKGSAKNVGEYPGQVVDDLVWGDREDSRGQILKSFIPGYANQALFSDMYEPRNVLLSIGGNDIHFADILTSCVSPQNTETCYSTYESRTQLMQSIIDRYNDLVKTYKTVADSSYGKVFVIAYPQVAKPGGSCGANVNLNKDELQFSADVITYLNSVIKRAASDAGVIYVDNENALNGYRLCEAPKGRAAVNGFTLGRDSGIKNVRFIGKESYHPTALGHKLLADSIRIKTNNLKQAMPSARTNYGKPVLDLDNALLKNAPKSSYTNKALFWEYDIRATRLLTKGVSYSLQTHTNLMHQTDYIFVMHSTPRTLAEGVVDGDIAVTIPTDIESGFHTLDLYGTDTDGNEVDIRQVVFVASQQEYEAAPCLGLPTSGQDSDADGLDDACDADPDDPSVPGYVSSYEPDEGGLLAPVVAVGEEWESAEPSEQSSNAPNANQSAAKLPPSTTVTTAEQLVRDDVVAPSGDATYKKDAVVLSAAKRTDTTAAAQNTRANSALLVTWLRLIFFGFVMVVGVLVLWAIKRRAK